MTNPNIRLDSGVAGGASLTPPKYKSPPLPRFDTYEQGASMLSETLSREPPRPRSRLTRIVGGLRDIVTNPLETAKSIGRGTVNMIDDTAETLIGLASRPFKSAEESREIAENATGFIDAGRDAIFGPRSDSAAQNFVEDTAQFVTGFIGAGKIKVFGRALSTLKPVVGGAVRGAVVDFAAFDPYKAQLAELAASTDVPGISALGDMLSVTEDDGVVVSRFKRAVGGLIPGVAIDGLVASARLFRNVELLKKTDLDQVRRQKFEADVAEQVRILDDIAEGRHQSSESAQVRRSDDGGWFVEPNEVRPEGLRLEFPTRWEAESQAASINEALAVRQTAKIMLSGDQASSILRLAEEVRTAGNSPEKLLDAFGKVRFNFGYMDPPEKTQALLTAIASELDKAFEQVQGRPVVTFDESIDRTLRLAGMLTREDAPEYLRSVGNILKNADANVLLMNQQLTELGEGVAKWSRILDGRLGDLVAEQEARLALQAYIDQAAEVAGVNSSLGRALNALKARGDDRLKQVKMKGEPGAKPPLVLPKKATADTVAGMTAAELREVTRLFRLTKEPRVLFDTLASELQPARPGKTAAVGRGLLEYFYNSVLSNPATHAAIYVANGTVSVLEDAVRLLAGSITRNPEMIRGATDLLQGRLMYGKQSLKGMALALKAGHSIIDPKPVTKAIPGLAGEVVRTLGSRPMAAMDEFWRVNNNLAYVRMRSLQLARREAAAQGIEGKELDRFLSERVEADVRASIDPATGASRLPEARAFASLPTFSSPLQTGSFGAHLEELVQRFPMLVPVMPFVRTSINVMDYSFAKSTPLGMFWRSTREAIAKGGEEGAIIATRMAVGTTIWGTAGLMALGDDITGRGPSDPKLRKLWLASHQPYSIRIGGKWVSYRRAEPFATALSITADLAQIMRDNSDNLEVTDEASRVWYGIIAATATGVTNKTYLTGLVEFMDAIGSGDGNAVKRFVDGTASTMIPSVTNVFNRDPVLRETRGLFDALQNRIPGWSQSLPARYNVFGEPITLEPSRTHRALNPFAFRDAEPRTEDELLELDRAFQPPPTVQRFGQIAVNLHSRQYQNTKGGTSTPYERLMELVSETNLRGKIDELMASPRFANAGDGTEVFAGGRRYRLVQDLVDRTYDRAEKKMLTEYPELRQELRALERARRASQRSDVRGESILQQMQ